MDIATEYAWKYAIDAWGEAYEFEYKPDAANPFTCKRRDNGLLLEAKTVELLLRIVRRDYGDKPVPRSVTP